MPTHADGHEVMETQAVHPYDPLRFHGIIVWLTEDQGGRPTGPPLPTAQRDYAANGYVPPLTVDTGLASLVVRPATPRCVAIRRGRRLARRGLAIPT